MSVILPYMAYDSRLIVQPEMQSADPSFLSHYYYHLLSFLSSIISLDTDNNK